METLENSLNHEVKESEDLQPAVPEELKKASTQHEDIPSFSEWTQKQLAEAEKKKTGNNETNDRYMKSRGKFRNKNYASPDCGAKIVAANPESLSSSSVLSSLKDEYMLNYCTNRIWFVVELCEAIQAQQLDLANFELFSSSPKHFSVFVSHRFPTREWSNVGKFTAKDTRDVQNFNLDPHLFGKYVKVEMHSHYGREQFCPISWVGIYGTSEYEVLAKEDEERNMLTDDDDGDPYDEELLLNNKRDSPKNLFSSATDAVLSIVKKATAPFMKTENNDTETSNFSETINQKNVSCVSPRYITVCNNCSQSFYDAVYQVLSCQSATLSQIVKHFFVKKTLVQSETCLKYGLDFTSLIQGAPFPNNYLKHSEQGVNYLTALLKSSFVAALCNVVAVSENKVVVNSTADGSHSLKNLTQIKESCEYTTSTFRATATALPESSLIPEDEVSKLVVSQPDCSSSSLTAEDLQLNEPYVIKIEPTKTMSEDDIKLLLSSNINSVGKIDSSPVEDKTLESMLVSSTIMPDSEVSKDASEFLSKVEKQEVKLSNRDDLNENKNNSLGSNTTNQDSTLESIISDINAIERAVNSASNTFIPASSNLPAESIFLRLANRIKNLEINMSLSSTYLEELSRRYRMQLELLSKTLNLTVRKMEENSKIEEERERRREREMTMIRMQLANLTRDVSNFADQNSWSVRSSYISQHLLFIVAEIILVWFFLNFWKSPKHLDSCLEANKRINRKNKRRNSLEGVKGHETPKRKVRRPSDEAMNIGLYRNYKAEPLKIDKKRKRRKKDSKCSLNDIYLKKKRSELEIQEAAIPSLPAPENQNSEECNSKIIPNSNFASESTVQLYNRFDPISSPKQPTEKTNLMVKSFQDLSSPIFMKTALAVRSSRFRLPLEKESSQESKFDVDSIKKEIQNEKKTSNTFKKYMKKLF